MTDNKVEELKDEATGRASKFYDRVKEGYEHSKDSTRRRARDAYEKAHHAYEKAADTSFQDLEQSVEDYTRTRPWKALAIAAGVGLAAGLLLRGRR